MKNWLDQDIEPGTVVYRGARDGNRSSFKVGTVLSVNEEKHTAKVEWQLCPNPRWLHRDRGQPLYRRIRNSIGQPDIDTLVVIDIDPQDYVAWNLDTP